MTSVPHHYSAHGAHRQIEDHSMPTPLFHASVAGVTGLAFQLAERFYFAPVEDTQLYRVEDQAALLLLAPVEATMAAFLTQTIVEPRLLALAERRVA